MEFNREKYLNELISRKHNNLIKVITGARRSGKSYLMNELFYNQLLKDGVKKSNIIRFAFDSDEDLDLLDKYKQDDEMIKIYQRKGNYNVNSKVFRRYIKDKTNDSDYFYILLDEIQILEEFIGTLNGLLRHQNFDIYVTGSNSHFLSSDIATEFKGRGSIVHILPLTFNEYKTGLNLSNEEAWKNYIKTGGIPLVALMKNENEQIQYLKELCSETYLKDIVTHNNIHKELELGETLDIIASNIGSPINITKLVNTFKSVKNKDIGDDLLAHFINYFEDAFLVTKAKKYNIKGKKYINSPFKIYFEDIGVRNARLDFRQIEETHIMENIIYNDLRYKGYSVDIGEVNINEKTNRLDKNGKYIYAQKNLEVDFIASKGDEKLYIQSVLNIDSIDKEKQEKKSLYYINDSFKKIIITKNGLKPYYDENGIEVIDLFDFLDKDII